MEYRQAQPVMQADPTIVLDQHFSENAMDEMRKLGAMNAAPPLAPSTHLKNRITGVILPWTPGLAEMRDILVNCDEYGNTDPAAWKKTARREEDIPDRDELTQMAYAQLRQPEMPFLQREPPKLNEPVEFPAGAQTYDKFLDGQEDANSKALNDLSQAME